MNRLERWKLGRAARTIAGPVTRDLQANFGASKTYTEAQVAAACGRVGLRRRHLRWAIEMFADTYDCERLSQVEREHALRLYDRVRPRGSPYAFDPVENAYTSNWQGDVSR